MKIDDNIRSAYSDKDVIKKLIDATDILLHEKDYDQTGHEEYSICLELAIERFVERGNGQVKLPVSPQVSIPAASVQFFEFAKFYEDLCDGIHPSGALIGYDPSNATLGQIVSDCMTWRAADK